MKVDRQVKEHAKMLAIARVVEAGEDIGDVARHFCVTRRTLSRWIKESSNQIGSRDSVDGLVFPHAKTWLSAVDLIASVENECVAVARDGEVPLQAALRLLQERGRLLNSVVEENIEMAESAIEHLMAKHGLRQRRKRSIEINGRPIDAWVYYSPSEEQLFLAIDDPHPLLLAVTPEPHRFTRAIIERHGAGEHSRPTFIWTSASGLFEIESGSGPANFHPIAIASRLVNEATLQLTYLPELRAQADIQAVHHAEQLKEACEVGFEAQIGDRRVRAWAMLFRDDKIVVGIIDGPEDEDEGPPLNDDEQEIIGRAIRDSVAKAREFAHKKLAEQFQTLKLADVISHLLSNPIDEAIVCAYRWPPSHRSRFGPRSRCGKCSCTKGRILQASSYALWNEVNPICS